MNKRFKFILIITIFAGFSYSQIPNPTTLMYPCGDTVRTLTPTLHWDSVPSAINYRVQVFYYTALLIDTMIQNPEVTIPPNILNYNNLYYWRVAVINISGQGTWSALCNFTVLSPIFIKEISSEVPNEFKLEQNYPNPFNAVTSIKFSVPMDSRLRGNDKVVLKVFDLLGKEVATLVNEYLQPGTYETTFDASMLTSGIYFYRLQTEKFSATKKLILLK